MKRRMFVTMGLLIAAGAVTLLRADDSLPINSDLGQAVTQADCTRIWYLEQFTETARDPDAMAVSAILKAKEMVKGQNADQQADFFNKAMYETKSHAVARICRMELFELYKSNNRPDKAMEQLQALITEQPQ